MSLNFKKQALFSVLLGPVVTEKATAQSQFSQYTFKVLLGATKKEIKKAVSALFKVDVVSVNTIKCFGKKKVFKGRLGQRSDYKKAVVRLKAGQSIDMGLGA